MSEPKVFVSDHEPAPASVAEHDRLLVAACRAAFEVLRARQASGVVADAPAPLPASTRALLARLPRAAP